MWDQCKDFLDNEKREPPYWTFIIPILNMPDEVHFSSEEMSFLFSTKNDEVFNNLLNLEPIYNSIIPAWTEYKLIRERFSSFVEQKVVKDGVSEARFDASGKGGIMLFEINSLAENLVERADKDFTEARETLDSLMKHLNSTQSLSIGFDVGDTPSTSP